MVVGLTGGVGAGKSTVVNVMKKHFPVEYIHCDVIAHEVTEPGSEAYEEIIRRFGENILSEDKAIDRHKLFEAAFPTGRVEELNACIHPRVKEAVKKRLLELKKSNFKGYVLIEAALLIEAGYRKICDEIWYVYAPEELRKNRLQENRGYSEQKSNDLFKKQASDAFFRENSDFCISNDSELSLSESHIFSQIKKHLTKEGRFIE